MNFNTLISVFDILFFSSSKPATISEIAPAFSVLWQPWHDQIESLSSGLFGNSVDGQVLHLIAPRKVLSSVGSEHL